MYVNYANKVCENLQNEHWCSNGHTQREESERERERAKNQ